MSLHELTMGLWFSGPIWFMDQPDSALSWVEDSARLIAIHYQPAYVDRVGLHTCSVFYTLQEK